MDEKRYTDQQVRKEGEEEAKGEVSVALIDDGKARVLSTSSTRPFIPLHVRDDSSHTVAHSTTNIQYDLRTSREFRFDIEGSMHACICKPNSHVLAWAYF